MDTTIKQIGHLIKTIPEAFKFHTFVFVKSDKNEQKG
jgi:hypothetical protein